MFKALTIGFTIIKALKPVIREIEEADGDKICLPPVKVTAYGRRITLSICAQVTKS